MRRLPSSWPGAWCCARLLPLQLQCRADVSAALAVCRGGCPCSSSTPCCFFLTPLAVCVTGHPVRVSLVLTSYADSRGMCGPRSWSGCPSGFFCVSVLCLCALSQAVSASPPPCSAARAPQEVLLQGTNGHFQVVCAPLISCPSSWLCLSCVGGGGAGSPAFEPALLCLVGV